MPSSQPYSGNSSNRLKITIALKELGLPYVLHHVRTDHGERHRPEFLCLNPHDRMPVLVDRAVGIALLESAAVLQYPTETSGRLFPDAPREHQEALTWLTFHTFSMGPTLDQCVHFEILAEERYPPAIERYRRLFEEILAILDQRLTGRSWLAGEQYSTVDIATFGWIHTAQVVSFDSSHYRYLDNWHRHMTL